MAGVVVRIGVVVVLRGGGGIVGGGFHELVRGGNPLVARFVQEDGLFLLVGDGGFVRLEPVWESRELYHFRLVLRRGQALG